MGAVCLLVVYVLWLWSYLRGDGTEAALEEGAHVPFSFGVGIAVLAVAGSGAALVSDWFVNALDPAVTSLGISKSFTGLVIVGSPEMRSRTSSASRSRRRDAPISRCP